MKYSELLMRLRAERLTRKISVKKMAEGLGLSACSICNMEKGKTPITLEKYLKMCEIMDVDVCTVFKNNKNSPPNTPYREKELEYMKVKMRCLEERDFRILKDLLLLMTTEKEDL